MTTRATVLYPTDADVVVADESCKEVDEMQNLRWLESFIGSTVAFVILLAAYLTNVL